MKEIIFVFQNKGGVGKSICAFLMAEKYKSRIAYMIDTDTSNRSITKYLSNKDVEVIPFSFFSGEDNNEINQQGFNNLIEKVSTHIPSDAKKNIYIVDCSATVSETLFSSINSLIGGNKTGVLNLVDMTLKEIKIKLNFFGVVSGGELFRATSNNIIKIIDLCYGNYLKDKEKLTYIKKYIDFTILQNLYKSFNDLDLVFLNEVANEYDVRIEPYTITKNTGAGTDELIAEMFNKGKGFDGLTPLPRIQFKNALKNFNPLKVTV